MNTTKLNEALDIINMVADNEKARVKIIRYDEETGYLIIYYSGLNSAAQRDKFLEKMTKALYEEGDFSSWAGMDEGIIEIELA
jgi:hypothetical protein